MTIQFTLDTDSIANAIDTLKNIRANLLSGVEKAVDIMTTEGAEVAQSHYGDMASVEAVHGKTDGQIVASGEAVVIAEFGAGDAPLPVMFEKDPGFIFPGSYSLMVGSKEYALTGKWHFGGKEYTEVEPRAGLYNTKYYIKENAEEICKEVIHL